MGLLTKHSKSTDCPDYQNELPGGDVFCNGQGCKN